MLTYRSCPLFVPAAPLCHNAEKIFSPKDYPAGRVTPIIIFDFESFHWHTTTIAVFTDGWTEEVCTEEG